MKCYVCNTTVNNFVCVCKDCASNSEIISTITKDNIIPPDRCELCVAWTVCRTKGGGKMPTNIHGDNDCLEVQKQIAIKLKRGY